MKNLGKGLIASLLTVSLAAPLALIPADADAQKSSYEQRQKTKNEWRNIAIGSGLVALFGLVKDDPTLTFAGSAGALYSAWRYEEDRKSQNSMRRARAELFSRSSFTRNGTKYVRHTKYKGGKKYYYFAKAHPGKGLKKSKPGNGPKWR
ncbi:MAG TPA: hypothetical protein PLX06_04560 [Fimbriimonadaceae bacterium]|nr:hypothetical protein [Fimbriimonadaceae bacterium]